EWFKKLLIPGLVSLIPIVGQLLLMGFGLNVAKRVIRKDVEELPELDFGDDLKRGFMAFVVGLGYGLPIILLSLLMSIVLVAIGGFSGESNSNETVMMIYLVLQSCFGIFAVIYGLAMSFFSSAALGNFLAEGEQLSAAFRFTEIWSFLKTAIVPYLIVIAGAFVANLIGGLGSIICVVGLLITLPYAIAVYGHLLGQAYNEAQAIKTT
ncbi:MAG: DUF4013 domain-containing protein, partial [Anaerolineaceae bacterium]|nr:DUF4013 domain-containing protein [Anaerolineaceae bacterium]